MKPKGLSASQVSQTITNMTINRHIRLTSGKTSDQNFISGKFYCTKSCAEKFQEGSWGEFLRFNDV